MRTFDPQRFGVVATGNNLFLRGNIPLDSDGGFAYDSIRSCVQTHLGDDLNHYELKVVSLIDNVSERELWVPEMSAFNVDTTKYPEAYWPPWMQKGWAYGNPLNNGTFHYHDVTRFGKIVWWPIEAGGNPPAELLGVPGWNLDGLVDSLNEWHLNQETRTAVYVHCTLGADRTGAAIASYLVKYGGLNADQAIDSVTNGTAAKVPPSPAYQELIRLYAAQFGR